MLKLFSNFFYKSSTHSIRRMSSLIHRNNIVWMDMEMTGEKNFFIEINEKLLQILMFVGLDVDTKKVLQVAMLVTDSNLKIISPAFVDVIKQSPEAIDDMNDWCKENLKDLAESSLMSNVTEAKAEDLMLEYLKNYVAEGESPLAGNTIYMDRKSISDNFSLKH